MQLNKIFNYKKHIITIFRPYIDYKIKGLNVIGTPIPDLIVSLTTYDKRIKDIKYTLYSLFTQSIRPEKIVLCISPKTLLPKELDIFIKNGLEIEYCEDIGPYTKLIPTLKKYPNKIIVTADDDIFYPKDWLKTLHDEYTANPKFIHCHRAHQIIINNKQLKPYEAWEKHISKVTPSYLNFLTGVGGVLYPPNCFNKEVLKQESFLSLSPNADDVWFWAMAVLSGRKINVVKNNIKNLRTTNILTQLGKNTLYSKNKQGGNDTQISAVLNEYPDIFNKLQNTQPTRLIFDVSSLYVYNQKNGKRAGVYNVAFNLLTLFLSDESFDVSLYTDYKYHKYIEEFANELNCKLIDGRTLIEKVFGNVFWIARKFPHKLKYAILYTLRILDKIKPFNKKLVKSLNTKDIYFSPFDGIPKEVLSSKINKYQFIHDIIPLLETKSLPPYHWASRIFNNINSEVTYFTNSQFTKDDFTKYFPYLDKNKVKVAHLGHQKQEISKNNIYEKYSIPNKKYILSLCAIGKRKNLEFAIKCFNKFIKQHNIEDLVLVLAGSCWASYKNKIKKSGLNDKIIFTGYIDDNDIPNIFTNALFFVYPSLYEGFGLPIIEAMSYNTPVITSNKTCLPEIAEDAAILIDPTDESSLINAFERLYYNIKDREEYVQKGALQAQKFSWGNCYNQIKKEFCRINNESPNSSSN